MAKINWTEYVGKKIGNRTILSASKCYLKVACDCGKIEEIEGYPLLAGKANSCKECRILNLVPRKN